MVLVLEELIQDLLIFIGIGVNDTKADIKYLARKVSKLRVFEDSDKKINYSLKGNGQILLVSQFTLYGDCSNSNRPSFSSAALAEKGELFYNNFIIELKELGINPVLGEFGANMQVELINDGPMTLCLSQKDELRSYRFYFMLLVIYTDG